jgi:hypothetical protein
MGAAARRDGVLGLDVLCDPDRAVDHLGPDQRLVGERARLLPAGAERQASEPTEADDRQPRRNSCLQLRVHVLFLLADCTEAQSAGGGLKSLQAAGKERAKPVIYPQIMRLGGVRVDA